jgi:hypothetical protein
MAAMAKVLGIAEFLDAIITYLPAPVIHSTARSICKTWYHLVKKSPTIRRASVLWPTTQRSKMAEYIDEHTADSGPRYDYGIDIRLHPRLFSSFERLDCLDGRKVSSLVLRVIDGSLARYRTDYITTPRCCAVRIDCCWDISVATSPRFSADAFCPMGLTVGDTIDVVAVFSRQAGGVNVNQAPSCFSVVKAVIGWDDDTSSRN